MDARFVVFNYFHTVEGICTPLGNYVVVVAVVIGLVTTSSSGST